MAHLRKSKDVISLFAIILALTSCGRSTIVSEQMLKDRIDAQIPLGSNPQQVLSFLNSLQINGLRAKTFGYVPDKMPNRDGLVLNEYQGPGKISSRIDNAGKDSSRFLVYSIEVQFYFDKDSRLVSYKTETLGDW